MNLLEKVQHALDELTDPEIPVVTLRELGILREIIERNCDFEVVITPTYSGCPAMDQITNDIVQKLDELGVRGKVTLRMSPAWTTDWMTQDAKRKLQNYGIAPPQSLCSDSTKKISFFSVDDAKGNVVCPVCSSTQTELISQFGSTSCKALYRCMSCREPFDYFKPY